MSCWFRGAITMAIAVGLATAASAARASLYIYEVPGGGRLVTDHRIASPYYKLLRTRANVKGMGTWLRTRDADLLYADPRAYDGLIKRLAARHQVNAALVKALIHAESGFNPRATSKKGAGGLMQLMPDTARRYGVRDVFDPRQNLAGGVRYLKDLLDRFHSDHLAIAAYNAGEGAVEKYKGVPPFDETRAYVRKVLRFKTRYMCDGV